MTRKRWLWVLGLASLALLAVLAAIDARLMDEGDFGIIDFELAGSRADAEEMLAAWGPEGRDDARLSLWLDYPYIVAYGAFWVLAVAAVRDLARRRAWRRFAGLGAIAVAFPIGAAACDALENVGLLLVIGDHGRDWAAPVAMGFAVAKFALLAATVAYVLAGLARVAWARLAR